MTPKPHTRTGKESNSLSKGPKAGLPVMSGSKQTLRTSSRCWKDYGVTHPCLIVKTMDQQCKYTCVKAANAALGWVTAISYSFSISNTHEATLLST